MVQRNRLQWFGHILRKYDDDWVNKCVTLEGEEEAGPGKHGNRLWTRIWMICT